MNNQKSYHKVYEKPKQEIEFEFLKKHVEEIVLYKTKYTCFVGYAIKPEECIYIKFQTRMSYCLHPYILIIDQIVLEEILHRHKLKCTIEQFYNELVRALFTTRLYAYCFTTQKMKHGVSTSTLPLAYKAKTSSTQWEKEGDYIVIQFKMERDKAIALHEAMIQEKYTGEDEDDEDTLKAQPQLSRTISATSVASDLSSQTSTHNQNNLTAKPYMFVVAGFHQKRSLKDIIPAVNIRFDEYKEIYEQQRINEERIIMNRQQKYAQRS